MAELVVGGALDAAKHERTGDQTTIDSDDLTTHGVIVGMTGSGKTGLGIVLIEEVLSAGLPVLAIDPKGDLTNLCLTFPDLRPEDFRPWIDDSQAAADGVTPDEFAAQQAQTWKEGLASWDITGERIRTLREAVDFTIYTPGSSAGLPVNLVGSLQAPGTADAEIIGDEVEGFVSGLLGLVGIASDPLSTKEHILLSNLVHHAWSSGQPLDLPALVGMIQQPPVRKLGVFELDQFYPPADRTKLAMTLNGLLASPSFAAWSQGTPLDIQSLLYTSDGKARCAIVTTAHLSDEERQFVTSLVLGKLITWMRRQSGTSNLCALVYMDEVTGYLPPTENPPTKKPIMTLMKQARAFGVGVVLATQNPVDVDYKALSNAGTWMVGRLQTERDKKRLLDGMSAAAGGVDVAAVGDIISGLDKREFVLRQAGEDQPEVFTTRWAMSYLRGPLTREQIAMLMTPLKAAEPASPPESSTAPAESTAPDAETQRAPARDTEPRPAESAPAPTPEATSPAIGGGDETPVMPHVSPGVTVRYVDVASPWLEAVGASGSGGHLEPAIVARINVRYDDRTAGDVVHDSEYESVLFPLTSRPDVSKAVAVDYDDRDLLDTPPPGAVYRLPDVPLADKSLFTNVERDFADHVARTMSLDLHVNRELKLYSRPGEPPEDFDARCRKTADGLAEAETAKLRDKYAAKVAKLQAQIDAAEDRADVVETEGKGRQRDELVSTVGSVLGGFLSGRSSMGSILAKAGRAARGQSRGRTAERRIEEAQNKVTRLDEQLEALEAELSDEVIEIGTRWTEAAGQIATTSVPAEKSDVKVVALCLAWVPVA